jgi:kumamolisin
MIFLLPRPRSTRLLLAGMCLYFSGLAAAPGVAQTVNLAQSINEHVLASDAAADGIVHFQLAFRLRNSARLTEDNAGRRPHNSAELDRDFLPLPQDYDRVAAWLAAHGFTIEQTHSSRLTLAASGTVAQLSALFSTHFHLTEVDGEGEPAADREPLIPAEIADVVFGIDGLQPQIKFHKTSRPTAARTPIAYTVPYMPAALLAAYAATGLGNDGDGTTTAIVIDSFPNKADLTAYWAQSNVAQTIANLTEIKVRGGSLPAPSGEETIDTEIAGGMAPRSKLRVYASVKLSSPALTDALQRVAGDMRAGISITQVSISLAACETSVSATAKTTEDNLFAVITSLGASVFVASGDQGSHGCAPGNTHNIPMFFGTSPNVTAVGGTTLTLSSGGGVSSETAWSGSTGGISRFFAKPSYQLGLSYAKRAVPDIAVDANLTTGAFTIFKGQITSYGGTSIAAPMAAGLMARINGARMAAGKRPLGLLNSRIYTLIGSGVFRDITSGGNGGYNAATGYDLVTGIGAPLLNNLLPRLTALP